jgi:hypothetical protein
MAIRKSSSSGIPFGNTAGRPANPVTGQLYSNGEVGRLELYTATGWQNIVQETPGIASITGTYNESAGSGTFVISGTNFVTGGIAYAVGTNGVEYQASSSFTNSIVQMTATFTGLSTAYEPYDVKVLNPSNLFGLLPDAFYINNSPVWVTASGSLGTFNEQVSVTLSALSVTDSDSNTITYAVASGSSLPSGLSLNSSTGVISGTLPNVSSNTTYTFTINATDGFNAIPRIFSISSVALPSVTGGTQYADSTYVYRLFTGNGDFVVSDISLTADVLIVAGGGGGGSGPGWTGPGGGGAGSILYKSGISCLGTYPVTVGGGGAARNTSSFNNASNGGDSSFNATVALGGGGGGNGISHTQGNGANGGSGGGGINGQPDGQSYGGNSHINYPANSGRPGGSAQSSVAGWTLHANAGGPGYADNAYNVHAGGGGGGAGQAGNTNQSAFHLRAGDGGNGVNTYSSWATATSTGASGYYAGGGGGGTYSWPGDPDMTIANWSSSFNSYIGHGGLGGGGNGGIGSGSYSSAPVNGSALSGGGAGAGGYSQTGGSGGSGVVIVRYLKSAVGL